MSLRLRKRFPVAHKGERWPHWYPNCRPRPSHELASPEVPWWTRWGDAVWGARRLSHEKASSSEQRGSLGCGTPPATAPLRGAVAMRTTATACAQNPSRLPEGHGAETKVRERK